MLRLVVALGTDEWVFGFPQDDVVVGAAPESGLVLAHEAVAPRHVRLTLEGDVVSASALNRSRLVRVNENEVERSVVREGDVVEVGPYRLGIVDRDPPAEREQAFLDAIAARPKDDATRTVYADWLEENGRLDEARFLRAQIDARRMGADDPRFRELSSIMTELAPRMSFTWRRAVARPAIEGCGVQFELVCPKAWDELTSTERPDERWCSSCMRKVYYANDVARARTLALSGRCIAIDQVLPRRAGDLAPDRPVRPAMPRMLGVVLSPQRPPARER